METELPEPEVHRLLVHVTELLRLEDWYLLRPAPEESPESAQIQSHVPKPGVRQDGEVLATPGAPVAILLPPDMTGATLWAEHILPENNVTKPLSDLGF